ncbi:MAG: response regulator [Anaerolineae bacterium]|nr:response regulator [Anaerolineae bacterium]
MAMLNQSSVVLVVDDEEAGRDTLEGLLINQGYYMVFASNGHEALTKAAELTPDLILLDVMMPGLDGFEVCRRIRRDPYLGEVPILLITALDDRDSRLQGIDAGADDFISKPFNGTELRIRVRTITRLNRYRRLLLERTYRHEAEQEVYRRNRELTLLNNVITMAASSFEVKEILTIVCEALTQVFEIPTATATLFNHGHPGFDTRVEYASPETQLNILGEMAADLHNEEKISLVSHFSQQEIEAFHTPKVFRHGHYEAQWPHTQELLQHFAVTTVVIVPLIIRHKIAGFIELATIDQPDYPDHILNLAQSIAAAIAQSLETAQLYQNLQRNVEDLTGIVAEQTFELTLERDRTQAILEALGEAVIVTSVDGTIQYTNPAVEHMTGLPSNAFLGQPWGFWHKSEQEFDLFSRIAAIVRTGQIWRGEVQYKRQNGPCYDAALTAAPLFDSYQTNHVIGFVCVHHDITPLKEAERLKDKFVANVTHELNTPLSIATLLADNLDALYTHIDDSKRHKMINDIQRHMRVLNDLVESVLEIAQLDEGQVKTTGQLVNLPQIVREVIEEQCPQAQKKQQTIEYQGCSDVIVIGDATQLRQVVRNLLSNAIKYTPNNGRIIYECLPLPVELLKNSIDTDEWPGLGDLIGHAWAGLRISDTGIGISQTDIPHLFERFYRVKDQENIRGTGLGLAIVKELIKLHAGHIAVASEPGQGTIFAVYLPLAKD